MKSGVSWRAGSCCPRLRVRSLSKRTYEQKGAFSQCPCEILQSLPCHIPTPGSPCASPSLPVCSGTRRTVTWLGLEDSTVMFVSLFRGFPWPSTCPGSVGVRENLLGTSTYPWGLDQGVQTKCHCPAWVHCCPLPVYNPGTYSNFSSSKDLSSAKVPWSHIVILTHTC